MRKFLLLVLSCVGGCLLFMPGCDGGEESDPGAALGEACQDGGECKSDLFCFVEVDGQPGKCEAIPSACSGDPKCTGDCFDEFKMKCAGGSGCVSFAGTVTLACNKTM